MNRASVYQQLEDDVTIRVFALQPGEFDDPIDISVRHHNLNTGDISYEALSYVWGDPFWKSAVTIDGQTVGIITNLHVALQYMRQREHPRILWADAVCINQDDVEERGQQIRLMKRIYSEASKVLIWTGTEDEVRAKALLELLVQIATFIRQYGEKTLDFEDSRNRESIRHAFLGNETVKSNLEKSLAFLKNEWFHRVWTFQEAHLSQKADIICGRTVIHLEGFMHVFMYLESIGIRRYLEAHSAARVLIATYGWARLTVGRESHQQLRLSTLLRSMFRHKATDSRDKIFAVLAMVSTEMEEEYRPDYSKTVEETYTKFAALMMNDEQHLSPLSDTRSLERSPNLPSWVADWRGTPEAEPLAERVRGFPQRYNASAGLKLDNPLVDVVEGSKLRVTGVEVDVVAWTVPLTNLHRPGTSAIPWQIVFRSYKDFYEQCNESFNIAYRHKWPRIYDHSDETYFSAFIRTLAADTLPTSTRRDAEDRRTTYLSHSELCEKSWTDILGPWMTSAAEREALDTSPGGPLTDIYGLLLDQPTTGTVTRNLDSIGRLRVGLTLGNLAKEVISSIIRVVNNRRLIVTNQSRLAVGPLETRIGDTIAAFAGGDVLYVIRETGGTATTTPTALAAESRPTWTLVGETYVHGLMDGEIWRQEGRVLEKMVLV